MKKILSVLTTPLILSTSLSVVSCWNTTGYSVYNPNLKKPDKQKLPSIEQVKKDLDGLFQGIFADYEFYIMLHDDTENSLEQDRLIFAEIKNEIFKEVSQMYDYIYLMIKFWLNDKQLTEQLNSALNFTTERIEKMNDLYKWDEAFEKLSKTKELLKALKQIITLDLDFQKNQIEIYKNIVLILGEHKETENNKNKDDDNHVYIQGHCFLLNNYFESMSDDDSKEAFKPTDQQWIKNKIIKTEEEIKLYVVNQSNN